MPENIDMMYQLVSDVNFLASQLITAICLLILCRDFIKRKRGTGMIGSVYFLGVVFLYYVPFLVDGFVLGGVVLYLLVRKINKMLLYKQENLEWREMLLMIIPSANGMVVYRIFWFYAVAYENEMGAFCTHFLLWRQGKCSQLAGLHLTTALYRAVRRDTPTTEKS